MKRMFWSKVSSEELVLVSQLIFGRVTGYQGTACSNQCAISLEIHHNMLASLLILMASGTGSFSGNLYPNGHGTNLQHSVMHSKIGGLMVMAL
jgi:hypothetical protein